MGTFATIAAVLLYQTMINCRDPVATPLQPANLRNMCITRQGLHLKKPSLFPAVGHASAVKQVKRVHTFSYFSCGAIGVAVSASPALETCRHWESRTKLIGRWLAPEGGGRYHGRENPKYESSGK